MRLVIYTDINPSGGTEADLKKWMDRTGNPHFERGICQKGVSLLLSILQRRQYISKNMGAKTIENALVIFAFGAFSFEKSGRFG